MEVLVNLMCLILIVICAMLSKKNIYVGTTCSN